MRTRSACRSMLESVNGDSRRLVRKLGYLMGATDKEGEAYYDQAGNRIITNPRSAAGGELSRLKPGEFSLRALAESLLGEEQVERHLAPDRQGGFRALLEDNGAGAVQASAFANINAFTAITGGLLEVSVMEGWQNPMFIADQLAPVDNTRMFEGRKVIGSTRFGDAAEERLPGMPTRRAQIGERWIEQPRTVENSLACEVTQEAVYLDLTGTVLQEANDLGTWLGLRKEYRVIDAFIGVTNTYKYKGVGYNSFISGGYFDNDVSSNILNHYTNIKAAEIKFRDMKDPETNTRVLIQPDTILVNRERLYEARMILGATNVQYRDAPGATATAQNIREAPNPLPNYNVIESPLVYERCNAASGLNLNASDSGNYWWLFQKGWLKYAQNWPLRTQQAAPGQLDMIDRGIVLFVKADERGVPMVVEPRKVVRNKP
jgi:hypothetical protein